MITTPTVLILGAGASAPFGYPVGSDLTEQIKLYSTPGQWLQILLREAGFFDEQISKFRDALRKSQRPSIDAFLETYEEDFMEIGKTAIAAVLMDHEKPDTLIDHPNLSSTVSSPYGCSKLRLKSGVSGDLQLRPVAGVLFGDLLAAPLSHFAG
jgi:hypothetical protein